MAISALAAILWLLVSKRWGLMGELSRAAKEDAAELGWVFLLIIICNGAVFAVLSTPIFFNAYEKIREHSLLSLLTWSLLPLIWLVYVLIFANDSDLLFDSDLEIRLLLVTMTLPYLIANPWTFIRYRRALARTGSVATHIE
jgi:hypothetical protein